jgi:predicted RNase H-like HicB family nuclease
MKTLRLTVVVDQVASGRWVAEVPELAGVFVAAGTADLALRRAKALALETLADLAELGDADIADAIHFVPPARAARIDGPTACAALALDHRPPSRG